MNTNASNPAAQEQPNSAMVGKAKRRSGPRSRSSPYKGVTQYRRTGKWEAHIWIPGTSRGKGHQRHLGSYETAEDAAMCFDRATIHVRGTQEELNFPLQSYSEDQFMLEHARTDKFKFLDLMRAKFAIASEAQPSGRPSTQAQNPRPKSNIYKNLNSDDDPDYSVTIRPSPSSALAGYLSHPSRPHVPFKTSLASKMLFKHQQDTPQTPQPNQLTAITPATGTAPGSNVIPALPSPRGGRRVGTVSNEARMSMRRLSNYTNQRAQQRQRPHGVEDEEEEGDDNEDVYTALIHQPPLFSPVETAWINAAISTSPTVAVNQNMAGGMSSKVSPLSFASTIAGMSAAPSVTPTVLPSRYIGTCGPLMPSSFPTIYNGLRLHTTGADAAHALQESFHLPPIIQNTGAGVGVGGGAVEEVGGCSGGSGHGDHMDPATDDLLAGMLMISGQDIAAEYKDWLCNSPCQGMAPSPSAAG